MSMLTPPGMGGKYRITGDRYPRMRRPRNRRRIMAAVVGSVAALALLGWGTVQLIDVFTGGGKATAAGSRAAGCATPKPAVTPSPVKLPKPSAVKVNVYNATKRSGLAKKTADDLKKRGFTIGKVDNAPAEYDKKVKDTALLLGADADEDDPRYRLLGLRVTDAAVKADDRKGDEIDLIIGDDFAGLEPEKEAIRAAEALAHPSPSPATKQVAAGC